MFKSAIFLAITSIFYFTGPFPNWAQTQDQHLSRLKNVKPPHVQQVNSSLVAGDTTTVAAQMEIGTSMEFSEAIASCIFASTFSESKNLPSFMNHTTTEVTVNNLGTVHVDFTLSLAVDAPIGTFTGTVTYTIRRGGSTCAVAIMLLEITTIPALPPIAEFAANPTSGIEPLTVQFRDFSTHAIAERMWDFGDGATSNEKNPVHTFNSAGSYSVSLSVTGPAGSDTKTEQDFINIFPPGTPGQLLWLLETNGEVKSPPAIGGDGSIYFLDDGRFGGTMDDKTRLYILNPDGSKRCAHRQNTLLEAPVLGTRNVVYVRDPGGFRARNTDDCSALWGFLVDAENTPAVGYDGTIYIGGKERFYAINPDGTEKWIYQTTSRNPFFETPAIGVDGTIYVATADNNFYAINPDGAEKWRISGVGGESPAIGLDGTIYVRPTFDGDLYSINSSGKQNWKFASIDLPFVLSTPIIGSDGAIYLGHKDGLFAINPDGSQRWKTGGQGTIHSTPAIGADGTIYFGSKNGNVYAVNPDGSEKWHFTTGKEIQSSPAIANDGTIYIGSSDKTFYAISSNSGGLANSAWPKFGQNNRNTGRNSKAPPYLIAPANNNAAIPINPKLAWSAVRGATGFELQVDTQSDFSSLLLFSEHFSESSVALDSLIKGTTYYWRTRAIIGGDTTRWSTVWNFTTVREVPSTVILTTPSDSATGIPTRVMLRWEAADRADSYRLQVSKALDFSTTFVDRASLTRTFWAVLDFSSNTTYYWRVKAANDGGSSSWSETFSFSTVIATGINLNAEGIPTNYFLSQNYPNPFNPGTTIRFALPQSSHISISIYSISGKKVHTLIDGEKAAGIYSVKWNGSDDFGNQAASGVYFYRIVAKDFVQVRKLTLLR